MDVTERRAMYEGPSEGESRLTASQTLFRARTAIREARDFQLLEDALDIHGIKRMVQSHETTILKEDFQSEIFEAQDVSISVSEASDRYLDHARQLLGGLASGNATVAEALDLLAAIQLGRGEPGRLPAATALCLRRAAFQGQPANGSLASRLGMQLADMGLDREAQWTLERAMSISPSPATAHSLAQVLGRSGDRQTAMNLIADLKQGFEGSQQSPRVPDVIQLTPEQFASVSPSLNATVPTNETRNATSTQGLRVTAAGYRSNLSSTPVQPSRVPTPAYANPGSSASGGQRWSLQQLGNASAARRRILTAARSADHEVSKSNRSTGRSLVVRPTFLF